MKKPVTNADLMSNFDIILCLVCIVVICLGGLMLGIKIQYPDAKMVIDPPILVIACLWSVFGISYFAATISIKKWLINECSEETENESG